MARLALQSTDAAMPDLWHAKLSRLSQQLLMEPSSVSDAHGKIGAAYDVQLKVQLAAMFAEPARCQRIALRARIRLDALSADWRSVRSQFVAAQRARG